MAFQVFLSYARVDNIVPVGSGAEYGFVTLLRANLGARLLKLGTSDAKIWRDKEDIADGEQFTPKIRNAIGESQMMILVLTPTWLKSSYCQMELEAFKARWGDSPQCKDRFMAVFPERLNRKEWPEAAEGQV